MLRWLIATPLQQGKVLRKSVVRRWLPDLCKIFGVEVRRFADKKDKKKGDGESECKDEYLKSHVNDIELADKNRKRLCAMRRKLKEPIKKKIEQTKSGSESKKQKKCD